MNPRKGGLSPAPRKYPQELRERAVRLVIEAMAEGASLSLNAAVRRIGPWVGIVPDTLRGWVIPTRIDQGLTPDMTTSDARRIKEQERNVKEFGRANQILLLAASKFFARELDPRLLWRRRSSTGCVM